MKYQIMMDIFFTLLHRKKVSARELAAKHEVSTRSIYRYVDELTVAGIPIDIQQGRGGGIYISDAFKLPVNYMSAQEYRAAIEAMKAMRGQIEDKALDSAIEKLSSQMKREAFDLSVTGEVIVDSSSWGDYRFKDKMQLLQKSIRSLESVEIDYVSRTGEHTKRVIDAHVLIYKQNVWYVYAHCHKRETFRLFKIGRIRTVRMTGKYFSRREFLRENIPLQFKQEQTNLVEVKLQISKERLPDAEEWLGVDCIYRLNNEFYAVMTLPDDEGLIRKILSLGTGVKIVYPERIKEAVKETAKKMIAAHE